MKKTYHYILLVLTLCFGMVSTSTAQNYIPLDDASGMNTDAYQTQLQAAADSLLSVIPAPQKDSIRVYDFGFYLHHETMSGGFPDVMQRMIDERDQDPDHPYYVLFGKQTDQTGIYTKLWVELKLPATGEFECLDLFTPTYRNDLYTRIRIEAETVFAQADDYAAAEVAAMLELKKKLLKLFDCCDLSPSFRSSTGCVLCDDSGLVPTYDMIANNFAMQTVEIVSDPDGDVFPSLEGEDSDVFRSSTALPINAIIKINGEEIELDSLVTHLQSSYQSYMTAYWGESVNVQVANYKYPRDCDKNLEAEFNTFKQPSSGDVKLYVGLVNFGNKEGLLGWRIEADSDWSTLPKVEGSFNAHTLNQSIAEEMANSGMSRVDLVGHAFKRSMLELGSNFTCDPSMLSDANINICTDYEASKNTSAPVSKAASYIQVDYQALYGGGALSLMEALLIEKLSNKFNAVLGVMNADADYHPERKKYIVMSLLKDYKCVQQNGFNNPIFKYTHTGINAHTFSPIQGVEILSGILIDNISASLGKKTYNLNAYTLGPNPSIDFMTFDEGVTSNNGVIKITLAGVSQPLKPIFESTSNMNDAVFTTLASEVQVFQGYLTECDATKTSNILSILETASPCFISQLDETDRIDAINCIVDNWDNIEPLTNVTLNPTDYSSTRQLALTKLFEDIGNPCVFIDEAEDRLHTHNFLTALEHSSFAISDNSAIIKRLMASIMEMSAGCGHISVNNIPDAVLQNDRPAIALVNAYEPLGLTLQNRKLDWNLVNVEGDYELEFYYRVCNHGSTLAEFFDPDCENKPIDAKYKLFTEPVDLISQVNITKFGVNKGANVGQVPAIMLPLLINKYEREKFYNELYGTANVGLNAVSLGFAAAQIRSGLAFYHSQQYAQAAKHIGLGLLDVGATITADHCSDPNNANDQLCQFWRDNGLLVCLGLVGGNFIKLPVNAEKAAELAVTARCLSTLAGGRINNYENIKNFYYRFQRGGFTKDDALNGILRRIDEPPSPSFPKGWPDAKLQLLDNQMGTSAFASHLEAKAVQLKAWDALYDIGPSGIAHTSDIATLTKMSDDLVLNSNLGVYLKSNPLQFDTWRNISDEFLTYRHLEDYIDELYRFRLPFVGNLFAEAHDMHRHVIFGDIEIQVYKNGQPNPSTTYFFPATKFMDSTPGSGGLVDKLDKIRTLLADPSGIYSMKPYVSGSKKMIGVKDLKGFHGQYDNCVNCANPYDGSIQTHDGRDIIKDPHVVGTLDDHSEVFKINNPSIKSPTEDGWNYIKGSGMLSPQQAVDDILNNNMWNWQQKTNGASTFYPQNLTTAKYEEIIAAATKEYDISIGGLQYFDVPFKGKTLNIRVSYNNGSFTSAFINDVN